MCRRVLKWEATDFSVLEARDGQYRYVIWTDKKSGEAELRFIRYDQIGEGTFGGIPFYDFSVNASSTERAMKLAEKLNRLFRKARRYNGLVTL